MTQREVKDKLYDLVAEYFALLDERGNIIWGRSKPVHPGSPMVALDMTNIRRPYRPARRYVDGVPLDSYPSSTILSVDLFTKGAPVSDEPGMTAQNENTAVNDLADFANFLNSTHVDHWCGRNGISLRARTVQDLTAVINDTSWQYRALLEVDVGFVQTAGGYSATNFEGGVPLHDNGRPMFDSAGYSLDRNGNRLPVPPLPTDPDGKPIFPKVEPTHSGGRTQRLADKTTGYFTEVEIKNHKEESNNGE